jgi:hypothetical protein
MHLFEAASGGRGRQFHHDDYSTVVMKGDTHTKDQQAARQASAAPAENEGTTSLHGSDSDAMSIRGIPLFQSRRGHTISQHARQHARRHVRHEKHREQAQSPGAALASAAAERDLTSQTGAAARWLMGVPP